MEKSRPNFLVWYRDEKCTMPIEQFDDEQPISVGETTKRSYFLKNTNPNATFSDLEILSNDQDVEVQYLKKALEPFDSVKVTLLISASKDRNRGINCTIQVSANGVAY